jgi:hypothetical protein
MNKVGTEDLNKVEKCLIMSLTVAGDGSRLSNDVTTILRYIPLCVDSHSKISNLNFKDTKNKPIRTFPADTRYTQYLSIS